MPSHFSRGDFATPWTTARQAPLSTGFSRQDNWNGLPRPPPGDIPDPGIKPTSLKSPALAGMFFTTTTTWEAIYIHILLIILFHYSLLQDIVLYSRTSLFICFIYNSLYQPVSNS